MIERRKTQAVMVGAVQVGGGAPITVQSMTKTHTHEVGPTVAEIADLTRLGCHIIRCAVPDIAAADAIAEIKRQISIPLIADIHFDHRLAIRALERGADAIRINPGNIRGAGKLDEVIAALRHHGRSVRIGVNAGSIGLAASRQARVRSGAETGAPGRIQEHELGNTELGNSGTKEPEEATSNVQLSTPNAQQSAIRNPQSAMVALMVDSALRYCEYFESRGVTQIKVSLKASDVMTTLAANRAFAAQTDYPLHVGVTEAGPYERSLVKSAIGIGALLSEGIGDTIRVSMTGPPADEVRAGHTILQALGLEIGALNLVSCPTCGRCRVDLVRVVNEVERALAGRDVPLTVAVMGCEVNGPGEAAEADIGVAAGRGAALLFKHGQPVRKIPEETLVEELLREIEAMIEDVGHKT